jgi:hypothetical protein
MTVAATAETYDRRIAPRELATWKIVTIGEQRSVKDLVKTLANNDFQVSDWARDILQKITLADGETEVELVQITVRELGFGEGACREAIYHRAKELGIDLVPAEVGPQLRLQYPDQPLEDWVLLAMEPVVDSSGDLTVFSVIRHNACRWLSSNRGDPEGFWGPDSRWVFAHRK